MISNHWEERNMNELVLSFHEEELKKMGLPDWAKIECPFCKTKLLLRSIRSISMKLNTRNMGDLALEFICDKCSKMDTLYFRKEFANVTEFIRILENKTMPKNKPILEEEMYQQKYNNIVEKMVYKQGE